MAIRDVVEDYRELLTKVDELYGDNFTSDVRKLNDDLVFSLRSAMRKKNKFFGRGEREIEKELGESLNSVRKRYDDLIKTGSAGLTKRLGSVKDILSDKMSMISKKKEEVRSQKVPLEAKAKALIKEGKVEEAEDLVPEITSLEGSEKLLGGFTKVLSKVVGRLSGLITKIDVLSTLRSINISKLDFDEVKSLKGNVESVASNINGLHDELSSVLSMSGSGILSGALSEEEKKTLKRLVAETGEVSEKVKTYMEEVEEVEEKYKEIKG